MGSAIPAYAGPPRDCSLLWVVEMLDGGTWHPWATACDTRAEGRTALSRWRRGNPKERFRLEPYARRDG